MRWSQFTTGAIIAAILVVSAARGEDVRARKTLPAGTIVTSADLLGQMEGDDGVSQMIGMETRRAIFAGQSVSLADLGSPRVVQRNEIVLMSYARGPLDIRAEGRALEPGRMGDRIRVINLGSRQAVTVVVVGPGRVEISQ